MVISSLCCILSFCEENFLCSFIFGGSFFVFKKESEVSVYTGNLLGEDVEFYGANYY